MRKTSASVSDQGELIQLPIENTLNEMVQISEENIMSALESAQVQMYDMDHTLPITIEIGATDRPQQDNSLILGINQLFLIKDRSLSDRCIFPFIICQ